jgi:hypothetical protein
MQPPVQQQPIQMPQPMQGAPGQALFSGKCWYMPQGKRSIFSGKEAVVTVYLGVAIITNALTHDEVQRWQMQGSKTDRVGGYVRMQELEGQKKSIFASGNVLYFYNPLFSMLSAFTMFFGGKNAKACQAAMKQAGAQ